MKQRLLDQIAHFGPLPFERFMAEALYGDGGFFSSNELRSVKGGDFLTSPEVSTLFGETLASFVRTEHGRIGEPFRLVEAGGGSGSLLRPLLADFPCEAWAVEASPAARGALSALVGDEHVVAALGDLPVPFRGVVLANELIDNLPMAIAQMTGEGWRERWVGASEGELCFVDAPLRPE
ncbi:MAG: SAM-dependent methyltransferase, partial [Acidimicrobiia bacterium]|nr:SAM-dependent methyltransferase [Acidimicrobiia bacterium]